MKIVVNKCFGGFGLSLIAQKRYLELIGKEFYPYKQTKFSYKDGYDEYSKIIELDNDDMFTTVSTKDYGDKTRKIEDDDCWYYINIERTDDNLVKIVEELGGDASGRFSSLRIVDIPDYIKWEIDDYDGVETIHEVHRSW